MTTYKAKQNQIKQHPPPQKKNHLGQQLKQSYKFVVHWAKQETAAQSGRLTVSWHW